MLLVRLGRLPVFTPPPAGWWTWLSTGPPEDVVVAVLRLVALCCAMWLLTSSVLYVLVRMARLPRALAAVEWVTLPVARRAADRAVAVLLTASATVGSAGAALAAPLPAVATQPGLVDAAELPPLGRPVSAAPPGASSVLAPVVAPPEITPPGADPVAGTAAALGGGEGALGADTGEGPLGADSEAPAPGGHIVVPGEHLWRIARERLAAARGLPARQIAARDVHGYWIALIEANHGVLRSGDPDLLFPGEQLVLPPVPPA